MNLKDTIQTITSIIFGIGALAAGLGYLLSSYRKGSKQENKEVVDDASQLTKFWKEQVEGFKAMVAEQNVRIQTLSDELNLVKGQLMEKERQNKDYLAILQNRNPEMEKFMNHMIQAVKDQAESHSKIVQVLGDIHAMTKAEHERDFSINATVTKK